MEPIVEVTEHLNGRLAYIDKSNPWRFIWILPFGAWPAYSTYCFFTNWRYLPHGWAIYAFWLVASAVFIAVFLTAPRRFAKRSERKPTSVTATVFYEDSFTEHATKKGKTQVYRSHGYSQVVKARETEDIFLIKHKGIYSSILLKKYLAEDQIAALRALFVRKFGDRFKIR